AFLTERDFCAINVTIPYKEAVLPHLSEIDEGARRIGAVNTIVNRGGTLFGYNTDFYGMRALLSHAKIAVGGKKVVILGTGGTSKTAYAVAESLGAKEILRVGRSGRENSLTYEELYEGHTDADILINTTPVGMYPNLSGMPVDLAKFQRLSGVIDAVYNPLCTSLILAAGARGIPAEGGLFMLVAQGVRASEIFFDTHYPEGTTEKIFADMRRKKENIVLVGMPTSGKSTVGKLLAERLSRPFIDIDERIEARGTKISEIFAAGGEPAFRKTEAEVIEDEVASLTGTVIATGGGRVLSDENVKNLLHNGRIYFLNRSLSLLIPTDDRPLAKDKEAIEKRYRERLPRYLAVADAVIPADGTPEEVADLISEDFIAT
ncbi:MAG TPA: shikimate dehydrogenase, partial [Clostridiales bacterium]|nr:shikimate dehydrogenase [Clostridiales bacterium]